MMAVPAERVVLTSAIVTMGSTIGASVLPEKYCGHGGLPSFRLLFGTALTFAGLSILADFAPKLASPLALAVMVTAGSYYGLPAMEAFVTDKPCKKQPVPPTATLNGRPVDFTNAQPLSPNPPR